MKTINETFEDREAIQLRSQKGKRSWHKYIMWMSNLVKKFKLEKEE